MSVNNFDYGVDWFDFTSISERPQGRDEDAEITSRYNYNYNDTTSGRTVIPDATSVTVDVYISRTSETWAVSSKMNGTLLEHEQGHYDITAIGARDFERTMLTLSAGTSRELKRSISRFNDSIIQKIGRVNRRYDTATEHSGNRNNQQTWQRQIAIVKANVNGTLDDLPS